MKDLAVEGLHNIFVGPCGQGFGDSVGPRLDRAEKNLGRAPLRQIAQTTQEGQAVESEFRTNYRWQLQEGRR